MPRFHLHPMALSTADVNKWQMSTIACIQKTNYSKALSNKTIQLLSKPSSCKGGLLRSRQSYSLFVLRAEVANTDLDTSKFPNREATTEKRLRTSTESFSEGLRRNFQQVVREFPRKWSNPVAAVGAISTLACIQVSASFLEKLEAVPFLPQIEIVIGTLVSINLAKQFFGGGEGRARIESFFEDMADRIQGIKGFEDQNDEEPSMLDVQLRALLDDHMQAQEVNDSGSGAPSTMVGVTANKAGLLSALRDFINARESKSRRINSLLRTDNERLLTEEARAKKLDLLLQEEKKKNSGQTKDIAELTSMNETLKADNEDMFRQLEELNSHLDDIVAELELVSEQREAMESVNSKLLERLGDMETENENLQRKVVQLEQEAEFMAAAVQSANASRLEQLLWTEKQQSAANERALKEQREVTRQLEASLEKLELERSAAKAALSKLEEQLAEARVDMDERENHIQWLQTSLRETQQKASQNEQFVGELQVELENAQGQVLATSLQEKASHAELEATLEVERKRYTESAAHMEAQLIAVQKEKEMAALHIRQLEAALQQSEIQISVTEQSAEEINSALKLATIAAEETSPQCRSTLFPPADVEDFADDVARKLQLDSPFQHATDSFEDGDEMLEDGPLLELDSASESDGDLPLDSEKEVYSLRELKSYARSIRGQFVDLAVPPREQKAAFAALVDELISKGADETWARKYMMDSMARERRKLSKRFE